MGGMAAAEAGNGWERVVGRGVVVVQTYAAGPALFIKLASLLRFEGGAVNEGENGATGTMAVDGRYKRDVAAHFVGVGVMMVEVNVGDVVM